MITRVFVQKNASPMSTYGISTLDGGELREVIELVRAEQDRRRLAKHIEATLPSAMAGMATAMLGVTHAMACRAHLRAWAGHTPFWAPNEQGRQSGSKPAHGRMWTAAEGAAADNRTSWRTMPVYIGTTRRSRSLSPLSAPAKVVRDQLYDKGPSWLGLTF